MGDTQETVILNNKKVAKEDLEKKKKEAENAKGMKIVEVSKGVFKTKLED